MNAFCEVCGSTLPFIGDALGRVVVPMENLDDDPGFAPLAHIFVESKAPWGTIKDSLLQQPTTPGSGDPPPD